MIFRNRSIEPEQMDDLSVEKSELTSALTELVLINKYLGGRSVTRKGIKKLVAAENSYKTKILDIGSGLSDSVLYSGISGLHITSADININTCRNLKEIEKPVSVICCDVNNLPFKNNSYDIIHLSLFLHHFSDTEIVELLRNIHPIANRGIVINDLRRSILAYAGIKIISMIFSKSRLVKNDGPLSVKRSFVKEDLEKLLSSAGFKHYVISRHWAFRWLVVIRKDQL